MKKRAYCRRFARGYIRRRYAEHPCKRKIVSSLMSEVDAAYAQLKSGDSESAAETLDKAIEHWLTLDGYTHIFHPAQRDKFNDRGVFPV